MINNNENFIAKIISLGVCFILFIAFSYALYECFFQYYFHAEKRDLILILFFSTILFAFLLAYTVSNSLKPFSWQSFKRNKTPAELRIIAADAISFADMIEAQKKLELEDRIATIKDNHNIDIMKLKAGNK